jgi:glycerate-2-kinase
VTALRRDLHAIVRAGIDAVEPGALVMRALADDPELTAADRFRVLAAGKAAAAMAAGASRTLGHRIFSGLIVATRPIAVAPPFETIAAGHPLPTAASELAGRRALALAASTAAHDRFLCLLSGGASALLAVPAPGISLDDKQQATRMLLMAGADITALNCVRKHLSQIKGGGLALRSAAGCHTLAISDVVGDDPAVIGSGPGVPDGSRFHDAVETLRRFGGIEAYPDAVRRRLLAGERGMLPETLAPGDPRAARATAAIIGSRMTAMDGACGAAERMGYRVVRIEEPIVGEARHAARDYVRRIAAQSRNVDGPLCIVSSGETTVRVTGAGKGGRNHEFVLAAAEDVQAFGRDVLLASVGTDGIDGPTDAAGAVADGSTIERARRLALDLQASLADNDSHAFFAALGDLVVTGETGTNVGDLQVFLRGRSG